MALIEIRRGEYIDDEEIEDPKCVRIEQFETETFRNYLLPKIKRWHEEDEAATEVYEAMRGGRSLADAVLDTIESLSESKTENLRKWVDEARGTHIFAYADFSGYHGLEEVEYGLLLTAGGPQDEIIAYKKVGDYDSMGIAPYFSFEDALGAIEARFSKTEEEDRAGELVNLFSEYSLVQILNGRQYDSLASAMGFGREKGYWTKSGLYDFREAAETDSPPRFSMDLDSYERDAMKTEAEEALKIMFQDDDWKSACDILAEQVP